MMRIVLILLALLLGPAGARAEERILDFTSEVRIEADASLLVTETIRLVAEGREVKRGILRDFPTRYQRSGLNVRVGFEVLAVERDGRPEPFAVEDISNGRRIRIGQAEVFLDPGVHTYRITYRTTRQLGFFPDYDELYWNVTGSAWTLPIESAMVVVQLPAPDLPTLQHAAYTGPPGAQGEAFEVMAAAAGRFVARTTAPVLPGEDFTIAVAWPKGHVAEPTEGERLRWALRDNVSLVLAVAGLFVVIAYYGLGWWRVGRDPPRGVVVPLFAPPESLSPAALRYVSRQGFDDETFAVGILGLGAKGHLRIVEGEKGYALTKRDSGSAMTAAESGLLADLFGGSRRIELQRANHKRLGKARTALREALAKEFAGAAFHNNRKWFWGGIVLSGLLLVLAVSRTQNEQDLAALFMLAWTSGWWFGISRMVRGNLRSWRAARGIGDYLGALFSGIFLIPFVGGGILAPAAAVYGFLGSPGTLALCLVAALMAVANLVFWHLLKAPTLTGRKLLDRIEGFRLYLSTAEEDRLNLLHPPERTPELFERFLPYAMALGCEHAWSERFKDVLASAGAAPPSYYHGSSWDSSRPGRFASSLGGSFSAATASAATAPGSRSGSGGGGSSGGGGGGGGGSGW